MRGLAAAGLDWRRLLGEDWPAARALLKPVGRRALAVACPSPGGDGCPRRVVAHDDGRITAVCGDRPRSCDPLLLTAEDVDILELDVRRLAALVSAALALEPALAPLPGWAQTWRLGRHEVTAGRGFPAFLTIQGDGAAYHAVAQGLCHATAGPFLLITADRQRIAPETTALLQGRPADILAAGDLIAVDGRGRLAATGTGAALLAGLRRPLEADAVPPPVRFPTPPGSRWEEVAIRFITQHQVHIRVRREAAVYEFSQMGMADGRRTQQPDVQWRLLQAFAGHQGTITWRDAAADRRNAKRRQLLAQALRAFFGIAGDPFERVVDGKGWRCRFTLIPES